VATVLRVVGEPSTPAATQGGSGSDGPHRAL
jgi:hypothetical protein